jgi:putative colanic acid biosynthesis glycosyltransferase
MRPSESLSHGPLFSVVTVVLNDEAGFRLTMASLRGQDWHDYEWIVVDGGSSDGTPALLAEASTGAHRWISELDGGIYEAMQTGTQMASGRWVVYMNAGDTFSSPQSLSAVAALQAERPDADILFGAATLVLPTGARRHRPPRDLPTYIWRGLPANHQATYFRRTRVLATPYDTSYRIAGDYALVASLYRTGLTPAYLNRSLVDFRVGDLSSRRPWTLLIEGTRVQRQILGLSVGRSLASYVRRAVSIFGLRLLSARIFSSSRARLMILP